MPTMWTYLSLLYFYSICFLYLFLIFCLLHFSHLIVYDTDDTLKVKYFVCDIFELNWNSYPAILLTTSLRLSSSIISVAFDRGRGANHQINLKLFSSLHHALFWWQSFIAFLGTSDGRPMWMRRFLIKWRIIGKARPTTDPFLPTRHNHPPIAPNLPEAHIFFKNWLISPFFWTFYFFPPCAQPSTFVFRPLAPL